MLKVGMKVEAYEGRCIGILIQATRWQGEITKVNRKSIRVRLTECVNMYGSKEKSRWSMNQERTYRFVKTFSNGQDFYRSEGGLYGSIIINSVE